MLLSSSPEVEGHITLHPLEGLIREWMVFNAASISLRRKHGLRNILIRAVIKMLLIFLIYLLSFFFGLPVSQESWSHFFFFLLSALSSLSSFSPNFNSPRRAAQNPRPSTSVWTPHGSFNVPIT